MTHWNRASYPLLKVFWACTALAAVHKTQDVAVNRNQARESLVTFKVL